MTSISAFQKGKKVNSYTLSSKTGAFKGQWEVTSRLLFKADDCKTDNCSTMVLIFTFVSKG